MLREKFAGKPWRDWPSPWDCPGRRRRWKNFAPIIAKPANSTNTCSGTPIVSSRECKETARKAGMAIGLYIDLAVGIHPDGADAWSNQHSVLNGVSVGAPPDELNTSGQDWGLAPFNPASLPDNDFAALRELLRAIMRHAGAIRIDHVLGLNRTYMIPRGMSAQDGTYVRFPFEALLRVIAEESNQARCTVIGEDSARCRKVSATRSRDLASGAIGSCCSSAIRAAASSRRKPIRPKHSRHSTPTTCRPCAAGSPAMIFGSSAARPRSGRDR